MNTKVIYFRTKSTSGPFSAADGEIESAVNVRLPSSDYASDQTSPDESATGQISGYNSPTYFPGEELLLLNNLSTNLLPVMEFSLQDAVVPGWHSHPDIYPSNKVDAPKTKDTDGWRAKVSDALSQFRKTADKEKLFVDPFLALCALRLTDGAHILPSSPVLLLPNTSAPHLEGPDDLSADSITLSVITKAKRLRCRISLKDSLLDLADRLESLDIFISGPLLLWNREEPLLASHRASGSTSPLSWLTSPLGDSEFTARILSTATFRMISSIPLTELPEYASFRDVCFNVPKLTDIDRVANYHPDFLQHHKITPSTGCCFSGRISLADLTLSPPPPPSVAALIPNEELSDLAEMSHVAAEIESVKNGLTLHSSSFYPSAPAIHISDAHLPEWLFIPDPDARKLTVITSAATYIFPLKRHPLLNGAFYWCGSPAGCSLQESEVKKLALTLPSPLPEAYLTRDSYRLPGAIWRSEKNSPLCFPDHLLITTENVRILALCRAFRASGLVATTAPTAYLFTTRGIYLLKEMDNGTLRDAGLIADYILGSSESITMSGTSLCFTTADGSRMQISGTSVRPVIPASDSSPSSVVLMLTPEDADKPIAVVTRPVKLSVSLGGKTENVINLPQLTSAMLSVELLGDFSLTGQPSQATEDTPSPRMPMEIKLYGSCNLSSWRLLAKSKGRRVVRSVWMKDIRYLRLELAGHLSGSIEAFLIHTP